MWNSIDIFLPFWNEGIENGCYYFISFGFTTWVTFDDLWPLKCEYWKKRRVIGDETHVLQPDEDSCFLLLLSLSSFLLFKYRTVGIWFNYFNSFDCIQWGALKVFGTRWDSLRFLIAAFDPFNPFGMLCESWMIPWNLWWLQRNRTRIFRDSLRFSKVLCINVFGNRPYRFDLIRFWMEYGFWILQDIWRSFGDDLVLTLIKFWQNYRILSNFLEESRAITTIETDPNQL